MSEIDHAFRRAQLGDREGFADWVRRVEIPLRKSLRSFARSVDVEAIVQEGLLRMWVLAKGLTLAGESASLRYALRLVRNLAIDEARRMGTLALDDPPPEPAVQPAPVPDAGLRRVILRCLGRLPTMPGRAIRARLLNHDCAPDRDIARRAGMQLNTFLQNIVRARRHLRKCLESHRVRLQEYLA